MNFSELTTAINNAFFKLESFMNGTMTTYEYFGFNEAFTKLFNEARKPDNFTYSNCKLIGQYWGIGSQITYDWDKGDFENDDATENDMFNKDCDELEHLTWERIEEFTAFSTPDEIAEFERKFSITDILKAPAPPPPPTETKTDTFKAKLGEHGFFELPKVKILTDEKKQQLVELVSKNPMPYGIAMFDFLGFCECLDREQGTKYKANQILSKLYNEKANDGTSAKHYRRSLVKPLQRYKAGEYKETVKTDYQNLQ